MLRKHQHHTSGHEKMLSGMIFEQSVQQMKKENMECKRKEMHHIIHCNYVLTTEKHCNGSKPNQGHIKRQHSVEKRAES